MCEIPTPNGIAFPHLPTILLLTASPRFVFSIVTFQFSLRRINEHLGTSQQYFFEEFWFCTVVYNQLGN